MEFPRITSSNGSSGRDSGEDCRDEGSVDREEEVGVALFDIEDDFV